MNKVALRMRFSSARGHLSAISRFLDDILNCYQVPWICSRIYHPFQRIGADDTVIIGVRVIIKR